MMWHILLPFLAACGGDYGISSDRTVITMLDTHVARFEGVAETQKLDLLFAVDESGSMSDEQGELQKILPVILSLLEGSDFDGLEYHVGVGTTDPSEMGIHGWVSHDQTDIQKQLTDLVAGLNATCSTETCERGLDAVLSSVYHDTDFHRDDSDLEVVFISDENDEGTTDVESYLDQLDKWKPDPYEVVHASIVHTPDDVRDPTRCESNVELGTGYIDVSSLSVSLCDPTTWWVALEPAQQQVPSHNRLWSLDEVPLLVDGQPVDMVVEWNGELRDPMTWLYHEDTNQVETFPSPPVGTRVTVSYLAPDVQSTLSVDTGV